MWYKVSHKKNQCRIGNEGGSVWSDSKVWKAAQYPIGTCILSNCDCLTIKLQCYTSSNLHVLLLQMATKSWGQK